LSIRKDIFPARDARRLDIKDDELDELGNGGKRIEGCTPVYGSRNFGLLERCGI
jgi:hypothetical protein